MSCSRLGQIRLPSVALVRGARVVGRALLLHECSRVEVCRGSIPTFHVGAGHLRGKTCLHRALILHFGHLLGFSRVKQVELLNLAVGSAGAVKLVCCEARIRSRVLSPGAGDGPRWYWANRKSDACPNGFNTEQTIKELWGVK